MRFVSEELKMSISSISSNSSISQIDWRSLMNQWKQDFKQLASALQSGDLAGAQKAYSALQQLQQNNQPGGQQQASSGNNPIQNDFAALGQALSSGDLAGAQTAFSQLQTDMKAAFQNGASGGVESAHHGHHHRHVSSASDSDTSSSTAAQSGTTGNTISLYA
jgi:DNA-binding FadR family transcriptional regulator